MGDGNGSSNFLVHEHAAKIRNVAKRTEQNTKHTTDNGNCANGQKKNRRKNNTAAATTTAVVATTITITTTKYAAKNLSTKIAQQQQMPGVCASVCISMCMPVCVCQCVCLTTCH